MATRKGGWLTVSKYEAVQNDQKAEREDEELLEERARSKVGHVEHETLPETPEAVRSRSLVACLELFDALLVCLGQFDVRLHRLGGERGEVADHIVHDFRVRLYRSRAEDSQLIVLLGGVHQTWSTIFEHELLDFGLFPFRAVFRWRFTCSARAALDLAFFSSIARHNKGFGFSQWAPWKNKRILNL